MVLLRCLTFNVWKNEGDYPRRIEAIAALLGAYQPDVAALQECFVAPSLGIDSVPHIAGSGYRITRFPAREKSRWHDGAWCDSRSDMAILTREKLLAVGRHALPVDDRDGERGALWVDMRVGDHRVRLACTHLTHLRDAAAQVTRARQAEAVMAVLLEGVDAGILMGDLNANSDDPALAAIFGHRALCPVARGMAAAPGGEAPANGAIDHVLPFATAGKAQLVSRRIICAPDAAGFPSDHPAILAEVSFS